jgi:hypothetical protein
MLQAGKSQFQVPMRSFNFVDLTNPYSRTVALRSTQSLSEMSTRDRKQYLWGNRARPTRKADNLTPSVSRLSRQYGVLNIS